MERLRRSLPGYPPAYGGRRSACRNLGRPQSGRAARPPTDLPTPFRCLAGLKDGMPSAWFSRKPAGLRRGALFCLTQGGPKAANAARPPTDLPTPFRCLAGLKDGMPSAWFSRKPAGLRRGALFCLTQGGPKAANAARPPTDLPTHFRRLAGLGDKTTVGVRFNAGNMHFCALAHGGSARTL